jgi:hypothetical protein
MAEHELGKLVLALIVVVVVDEIDVRSELRPPLPDIVDRLHRLQPAHVHLAAAPPRCHRRSTAHGEAKLQVVRACVRAHSGEDMLVQVARQDEPIGA